jgi:hypothetical protein
VDDENFLRISDNVIERIDCTGRVSKKSGGAQLSMTVSLGTNRDSRCRGISANLGGNFFAETVVRAARNGEQKKKNKRRKLPVEKARN